MSARVAVVDDDPVFRRMMGEILSGAGYVLEAYADGSSAIAGLKAAPPHAVFLDLWMPGMNGLEVCRALRADPATALVPIIMLTGSTDEDDQVLGFEVGADDYIHKPITIAVLLARLRGVLRRARQPDDLQRIVHGPVIVDPSRREVLIEGRPVNLTPTEYRILHALAAAPDRVLSRRDLLSEDPDDPDAARRNIDVHIHTLRRKLGRYHTLVDTAWGAGYRLGAPPASTAR